MQETLQEAIKNDPPVTPEEIWAILRASVLENERRQAEAAEESKRRRAEDEKRMAEWQAEHEKRMAEAAEESKRRRAEDAKWKADFKKQMKKISKQVGKVSDSIGGVLEMLVAARLWEKFSAYPYGFKQAHKRVMVYQVGTTWQLTEIDLLLVDTEWVMAVEVKRNVKKSDVEHHVKRLKLIRDNPPGDAKGKKLLGAVAGGSVAPEARDLAFECGFFVLELKGEAVELVPPPAGFSPAELACGQG